MAYFHYTFNIDDRAAVAAAAVVVVESKSSLEWNYLA